MHTYGSAYIELSTSLLAVYDAREASAIAHEVLEHITGRTKLQRISEKDKMFSAVQQAGYDELKTLLQKGSPIQYALGRAWFMGRDFVVDEHVLIPRPETEELVQWIADEWMGKEPAILDIGTGSGCIPVMLKLLLPLSQVTSMDISTGAIAVAKSNADKHNAGVSFVQGDFLDGEFRSELPQYDVIVSNPPYIPETEQASLHSNVRDYEPGIALFVPGDDALLFYRNIADFGREHLKEGGAVYCELHVDYALATQQLFVAEGYTEVEVRPDMHGNLRMLKAKR